MITCGRELVAGTDAMNQLLPIVASSPLPALVAAAGERASIRVLEFFAASGAGAAAPLRQIHRARSERSGRNYFTAAMISPPALCRAPRPRLVQSPTPKIARFPARFTSPSVPPWLRSRPCRGLDQGHARETRALVAPGVTADAALGARGASPRRPAAPRHNRRPRKGRAPLADPAAALPP